MTKKEKQTEAGDLAGMVQRRFDDTNKKMERGFTKNEEDHSEIAGGIRAILRTVGETSGDVKELQGDMNEVKGDVKEIKEMVKGLVDAKDLRRRVEILERKVGV